MICYVNDGHGMVLMTLVKEIEGDNDEDNCGIDDDDDADDNDNDEKEKEEEGEWYANAHTLEEDAVRNDRQR